MYVEEVLTDAEHCSSETNKESEVIEEPRSNVGNDRQSTQQSCTIEELRLANQALRKSIDELNKATERLRRTSDGATKPVNWDLLISENPM